MNRAGRILYSAVAGLVTLLMALGFTLAVFAAVVQLLHF